MAKGFVEAIRASGLSIYHSNQNYSDLFIPNDKLEAILNDGLVGKQVDPDRRKLRTRSKALKTLVCNALGYPVPKSFRKTKPRFPGQNFDTYGQMADNLQIWNEDISPSRRYVLIRLDASGTITRVRVVSGEIIAELDTTGTLTQKYQASSKSPVRSSTLVSRADTPNVQRLLKSKIEFPNLLPIADLFQSLKCVLTSRVKNVGVDQERKRGAELHRVVSKRLKQSKYSDSGQFPDILDQLLEVKLQTSPTIDLGLVSPDGDGPVSDLPNLQHRDVRYAVFYGTVIGDEVRLEHVVLSAGKDFFDFFRRFEGKITNKKSQSRLPSNFFD